jgi:hypothetical protein
VEHSGEGYSIAGKRVEVLRGEPLAVDMLRSLGTREKDHGSYNIHLTLNKPALATIVEPTTTYQVRTLVDGFRPLLSE